MRKTHRFILGGLIFLTLLGVFTGAIFLVTGENTSGIDQVIFWFAGRAVFLEGSSPYSDEIAVRSQWAVYDRLAQPGEDPLAYVYPPYTLLSLLPTFWMPFAWAQAFWLAFNILLLVSALIYLFRGRFRWATLSLLAIYPMTFSLVTGNFTTLLCTALIVLYCQFFIQEKESKTAQIGLGILSGWLIFKPQFIWLFLIFFCLAAIRKRYWYYLASLLLTLPILAGISFAMVPNWPAEWISRLSRYSQYNQTWPILTLLLRQILPTAAVNTVSILLTFGGIGFTFFLAVRWWHGRAGSLLLFAWCGVMTYLVYPHGTSHAHLTFLIPLFLWAMLQQPKEQFPVLIFWGGSLVVSWIIFIISKQEVHPVRITEWPIFFHLVWLIWYFWRERKNQNTARRRAIGFHSNLR
jgi:hypothetical protein